MMKPSQVQLGISPKKKQLIRVVYITLLLIALLCTVLFTFILKTKEVALETTPQATKPEISEPFPIGVNPAQKLITENPKVDSYFSTYVSIETEPRRQTTWFRRTVTKLAQFDWYQNLASPISRILVIEPGERHEQIAKNFGDILRWDQVERQMFIGIIASTTPKLSEGKFYPAHYVVSKDTTPETMAQIIIDRFNAEVLSRYTNDIDALVPLEDALIIASLLEREAYDFTDMRLIAGVIWNRLFIDMNLQLDATLQYAKGSRPTGPWWPRVIPSDKYIRSPFNTYQNAGLPPAAIANPAPEAILAALNPKETECIFYFHDKNAGFHCTPTYEEHVALLKKYYGRGK